MDPRGAPQWVARLMSRISWRISSGTFGLPLRHRYIARTNNSLRHHALSGGRSIHTLAVG